MKVTELRRVLKGTGAQILETEDHVNTVPVHQFRLADYHEIMQNTVEALKSILVDQYGNPYKTEPEENPFSRVQLGVIAFDDIADIKIRFARKKILVKDTVDLPGKTRDKGRYHVCCVVFGESPKWGPRRMWAKKHAAEDCDGIPF